MAISMLICRSYSMKNINKIINKPFFLYYPGTIPHAELLVPDDDIFERHSGKYNEIPFTLEKAEKGAHKEGGLDTEFFDSTRFIQSW